MTLKIAEPSDIDAILTLHAKYQVDSIQEADKADGFVATAFTRKELTESLLKNKDSSSQKREDEVLTYIMSGSWQFWSQWPMFQTIIKDLPYLAYLGQTLSTQNSYQYHPVCTDKSLRSTGMLKRYLTSH